MTKDQELLKKLKSGDKGALKQFYLEQKPICLAYLAKNFNMDSEQLNDIYQDSVLAFYQNILQQKLTELNSSLSTYLFAIAKNLSLKKQNKNLKIVSKDLNAIENINEELYDNENDEKLNSAINAYTAMDEPCKSILEMYYFGKLSMEEIASKLGYNNANVAKTQKARCIKLLRKKLIGR